MSYNFKRICIILSILLLNSCVKEPNLNQKESPSSTISEKKDDKKLYKDVFNTISSNLDSADEKYVDLKTEFENSPYLPKAALALAVAHIQKKEYILANFYLQEALNSDPSNELAKYLLSKNQFLYAKSVASDQSYLEQAIKALEVNSNIVADAEYKLLADSMLTRVQLEKVYNNQSIGKMYKRLNKNKAYELYINKTLNLNINPQNIYKP